MEAAGWSTPILAGNSGRRGLAKEIATPRRMDGEVLLILSAAVPVGCSFMSLVDRASAARAPRRRAQPSRPAAQDPSSASPLALGGPTRVRRFPQGASVLRARKRKSERHGSAARVGAKGPGRSLRRVGCSQGSPGGAPPLQGPPGRAQRAPRLPCARAQPAQSPCRGPREWATRGQAPRHRPRAPRKNSRRRYGVCR